MSKSYSLNDGKLTGFGAVINEEVPTPGADAKNITAVVRNNSEITGYQLDDGSIISKQEGVSLARSGGINGVGVAISKKGEEYLRTLPDYKEGNNLDSLPTVEEQ